MPNLISPFDLMQSMDPDILNVKSIDYNVKSGKLWASREVTVTLENGSRITGKFKDLLSNIDALMKDSDTPQDIQANHLLLEKLSGALKQADEQVAKLNPLQKLSLKVRQSIGNLFSPEHNKALVEIESKYAAPLKSFQPVLQALTELAANKDFNPHLPNPILQDSRFNAFINSFNPITEVLEAQAVLATLNKTSPALVLLLIKELDLKHYTSKPIPFGLEKELATRSLGEKDVMKLEASWLNEVAKQHLEHLQALANTKGWNEQINELFKTPLKEFPDVVDSLNFRTTVAKTPPFTDFIAGFDEERNKIPETLTVLRLLNQESPGLVLLLIEKLEQKYYPSTNPFAVSPFDEIKSEARKALEIS